MATVENRTPAEVVRELSNGRITLSELARRTDRPVQTIRNWTQNPTRRDLLLACIERHAGGRKNVDS